MRNLRLMMGFISGLLALTLLSTRSLAGTGTEFNPRGGRLGFTYNQLLVEPERKSSPVGPGLVFVYEFNLNSRFSLGIDLQYRHFSGDEGLGQLGYGLLMKHYLASNKQWRPYLEYGLLMSVTRERGRGGSGTAHDTRLAAGVDFFVGEINVFTDFSYHYSRLSFYELEEANLDYTQLALGYRW